MDLVAQYGPLAVFVGTFLEGETLVLVAGFLAHQGVLDPVAVAVAAFAGSVAGDQMWFFLGRRHADHPLVRRLRRQPVFDRVLAAVEDHPRKFILSFRFLYGLRAISPVALGLTRVKLRTFAPLNALSAAIWAAAFTAIGYFSGQAIEAMWGHVQAVEHRLLIVALVAVAAFLIGQAIARRRHKRSS